MRCRASQMIVRAREAEMQFLRQEASSLREELEIARMVPTVFIVILLLLPQGIDIAALFLGSQQRSDVALPCVL